MILIADTSPLNYLVQIDHFDIVERLYGQVIIPEAVYRELTALQTHHKVRTLLRSQAVDHLYRSRILASDCQSVYTLSYPLRRMATTGATESSLQNGGTRAPARVSSPEESTRAQERPHHPEHHPSAPSEKRKKE